MINFKMFNFVNMFSVSLMVAMDQPTVIKVLEYHINWFEVTGFTQRQVNAMF